MVVVTARVSVPMALATLLMTMMTMTTMMMTMIKNKGCAKTSRLVSTKENGNKPRAHRSPQQHGSTLSMACRTHQAMSVTGGRPLLVTRLCR